MSEFIFESESIEPGSKVKLSRDGQELPISLILATPEPDYLAECAQMIAEEIDRRILEDLTKLLS